MIRIESEGGREGGRERGREGGGRGREGGLTLPTGNSSGCFLLVGVA